MNIEFTANEVSYNEALDGDIVQIYFEEDSEDDSFNPSKYYVNISVNYEFPPCTPTVEWFDGMEENGSTGIVSYKMEKSSLYLWLDNEMSFYISFNVEKGTFNKINNFFINLDIK